MQKHEFGTLLISYTKINSEEVKDPNVRAKTMKLLQGNMDVTPKSIREE